jgi:hypothetical protein
MLWWASAILIERAVAVEGSISTKPAAKPPGLFAVRLETRSSRAGQLKIEHHLLRTGGRDPEPLSGG